METGSVGVNFYDLDIGAPFGGVKASAVEQRRPRLDGRTDGGEPMRLTAFLGMTAVATALLSGCQSEIISGTATSEATSTTTTTSTTSASKKASTPTKIAPRDEDARGPHPTIANYIADNDIQETLVHDGDPGAPVIDLPIPEGWEPAGADTPDWAYGAIVYTGPDAGGYTPSVIALLSRLTGNVDPQALIDHAPGELQNLPGWEPMNNGKTSTLSGFPAYQLGGTWGDDGQRKLAAQKTVVIPGSDGVYVLQLNVDALEDQIDIVGPVTLAIDDQTTIEF